MVAFPPLLRQLLPGPSGLPQPPELRKWCRAVARAGSRTMAVFSPQMRSHHVTTRCRGAEIGDSETGLGSDAPEEGPGGKQEGALRSRVIFLSLD